MSIGLVIKGPEGLVLAAESRITLQAQPPSGAPISVSFDNARKVLQFANVGAVTYGLGNIGPRSAYSFVPEFESTLPNQRLSVGDLAQKLSDFFMQQWKSVMPPDFRGPSIIFVVGGFNDGEPYGRVYLIEIPSNPTPREQQPNLGDFGITWGGQREILDRLINGYDNRALDIVTRTLNLNPVQVQQIKDSLKILQMQVPIPVLPLQDCIDLAIFFIRTTIEAQRLTVGIRGCGGPIDIATITQLEGFRFVQEKTIRGER